jgi:hypothetical protein
MAAAPGRSLLVSWLALGVLLAAPATAAAGDKTIVMLEVEGERTPRLLKSLERMVKNQHEILAGSVYRDAARRLRVLKLTPNNVKKVCAYLKVDGVIDGTVMQEEGSYRFIVRLRSGATGIIEKQIPMRLAQPLLSEKMAGMLAERLMTAIDNLPPMDKDGQDGTRVAIGKQGEVLENGEEEAEEPTGKGKKTKGKRTAVASSSSGKKKGKPPKKSKDGIEADVEEPERVASVLEEQAQEREGKSKGKGKSKSKDDGDDAEEEDDDDKRVAMKDGGDDDDGSGGDDEVVEEDDEDGEKSRDDGDDDDDDDESAGSVESDAEVAADSSSPRSAPALVNAGLSFVGRKLSFDYTGANAEQAPPGFSGTPVPGAYVVGEVYPAAFGGGEGVLANLGIGIVADRVIKLNSSVEDATGMGTVNLATRMWRYGANLRYRHNFGDEPNGYSVLASVGYNTAGFSISKGDAPGGPGSVDLPNVDYRYIDAGLGGRIPIFGQLSLLAEAKFLAPLDTGQIQRTSQYGAASVTGFDFEAVFEYQITKSFQARAGGRLMQMGYSFEGTGALGDRTGDGMNDVTGASDRYLGGFVTGGYSF